MREKIWVPVWVLWYQCRAPAASQTAATQRGAITKHRPRLRPWPKSKCCSRFPKLGAPRSGSLSVRSSKSHSFSLTVKRSDSFQILGEHVTGVGPTMEKEGEEGLAGERPPQELTRLLKAHFHPPGPPPLPKSGAPLTAGADEGNMTAERKKMELSPHRQTWDTNEHHPVGGTAGSASYFSAGKLTFSSRKTAVPQHSNVF